VTALLVLSGNKLVESKLATQAVNIVITCDLKNPTIGYQCLR